MRKIAYGFLCLGPITILGSCSVPESDLARELRQKSANRGLAAAQARGSLVNIIPFDSEPILRDCSVEADSADFSSDGSKVLWVEDIGVTIRQVNGATLTTAGVRFPNMHALSLSPDGRRFIFETTHRDASAPVTGLYLAEVGSDQAELLEPDTPHSGFARGFSMSAGWSTDGQSVVYSRAGEISKLNLRSKEKTVLGRGTSPGWSPDGKWIAYTAEDGSAHLMAPNGADQKSILEEHTVVGYLRWSPDSEYLLFAERYKPGFIEFFKRPLGSSVRLCIYRVHDRAVLPVYWFGDKGFIALNFGWLYNYRQFCKG